MISSLPGGRIGFYANQGRAHCEGHCCARPGPLATRARCVFHLVRSSMFVKMVARVATKHFPTYADCRMDVLMAVFYAGYTHVSLPCERLPRGGRIDYSTSADEGRTWSQPKTLYDGPHDDRDPSIVQLKSGRLICNFFSLAKSDDAQANLGWPRYLDGHFRRIWGATGHHRVRSRPMPIAALRSENCRTAGSCLGLYRETNGSAHGAVTYSDDGGTTWSEVIDIDNGGHRLDAETDIIELSDGRLYAAERPAMCYSISSDRGRTWSVSQPIGFEGHCPYFLRARDNIIVLAHRLPSTSLHYSLDEGKTWSQNILVDDVIGAYPSMVDLRDGSVLIVYYEEGAGSSLRAKRFRISDGGVQMVDLSLLMRSNQRRGPQTPGASINALNPRKKAENVIRGIPPLSCQHASTAYLRTASDSLTLTKRSKFTDDQLAAPKVPIRSATPPHSAMEHEHEIRERSLAGLGLSGLSGVRPDRALGVPAI